MLRKVVFTNGCFDVFHAGHVKLLCSIKQRYPGLRLIVGLNSDESVRRLKGPGRPVNTLRCRKAVLKACRYVDNVIPFSEDTPERLIRWLRPQVIVKDARYRGKYVAGGPFIESLGGQVDFVDPLEGVSTTGIIEKARGKCQIKRLKPKRK